MTRFIKEFMNFTKVLTPNKIKVVCPKHKKNKYPDKDKNFTKRYPTNPFV